MKNGEDRYNLGLILFLYVFLSSLRSSLVAAFSHSEHQSSTFCLIKQAQSLSRKARSLLRVFLRISGGYEPSPHDDCDLSLYKSTLHRNDKRIFPSCDSRFKEMHSACLVKPANPFY